MNQVEKYHLIASTRPRDVNELVRKMIEDGWQPFGNAFSSNYGICQPMVKYETPYVSETTYMGKKVSELSDAERRKYIQLIVGVKDEQD